MFLTVTALALTVLAIGSFLAVRSYRAERQATVDALVDLTIAGGRSADRFVGDRIEFLQGIAASPSVRKVDGAAIRQLLRSMLGERMVFDDIGWVSADGHGAVLPNLPLSATASLDLSGQPYVRTVRATRQPFVSDALPAAARPEPVVVLAVPAFDRARRLTGIVTGVVQLSMLRPPLRALPGSETIQILDRAGHVIVGERPITRLRPVANPDLVGAMHAQRSGVFEDVRGLDGADGRVVAFTRVDRAGWLVVADRSTGAAFAAPRNELLLRVATWFGFALVALAGVWWLARRLDRLADERDTRTAEFAGVAAALSAATTVDEIVTVVEHRGRSLLGAAEVVVTLVEGARLVARFGRASTERGNPGELPAESITGQAVVTHQRVEVLDPTDMDARFPAVSPGFRSAGLAAAVAVPLPRIATVDLGSLGFGFNAPRRLCEDEWQLVETLAERVGQAVARARLYEQERRARTRAERNECRLQRLQHFTAALANTNEVNFDLVVAGLRRATEAAIVAGVRDGDDRTAEGGDELRAVGAAMLEAWPETAADGIQVWGDASSMRSDRALPPLGQRGVEALVALSIRPAQAPAAVVVLGLDQPLGTDEETEERSFLKLLARQAALALERGALARMEHEARNRATALQQLAERLSRAVSTKDVADAIVQELAVLVGADAGTVSILAPDGKSLWIESCTGYGPQQMVGWERCDLDLDAPPTKAVRTGQAILLETREQLEAACPTLVAYPTETGDSASASLPLSAADGSVIGVVHVGFRSERRFDDAERAMLDAVARQGAQALSRALLFDAEQRAHADMEDLLRRTATSEARFRALVDASTSIVWSTDPAGVMRERSISWERFTGQRPEQCVGPEMGWLEAIHPDDRERSADRWREAVATRAPLESHYRLRRSDGSYRRMIVRAVPVLDDDGNVREWIGSNTDVETELIAGEALDLERSSRLEAERRARGRAELLAETMSALEQVAGVEARAQMLVDILVPRVADYASIEVPGTSTPVLAQAHRSRRGLRVLRALRERQRLDSDELRSLELAAAGEIQLLEAITPELLAEPGVDSEVKALIEELGPRSRVALPLSLGGSHRGAILLGLSDPSRRPYAPADVEFLSGLVERAGVLLANARIQEEEHHIALRLQRALLPVGPITHPQAEIAARYEPGSAALEVGGDWYDTFLLDDGCIGVGVGDVVGHGLESAAAMGRLRSSMATLATNGARPAELLSGLARFAVGAGQVDFATALYAVIDPEERTIRYAYAGHPPILVVSEGGETRWLEEGRSGAIGDDRTRYEREATASLEPGDVLLLYSDGLVERRGEGISDGLARLESVAAEGWDLPVGELCDQVLRSLGVDRQRDDDVVLLCLRLPPVGTRVFTCCFPAIPEQLAPVRSQLRAWLAEGSADPGREQALLLAVGEACSNAVEHAYLVRPPGEIDLQIKHGPGGFVVRVHDGGTWRGEHREDDRGRGSAIMHALSDEFRRETDDTGTTVTMRIAVPRLAHT